MMRRGSLILAAVLLAAGLAGCIGATDEEVDTAQTGATDELDRTVEVRHFEGTVTPAEASTHELEVPEDTVRFNGTLTTEGLGSAYMSLYGPDGQHVDAGQEIDVYGRMLEEVGHGTYELRVYTQFVSGEVRYEIEAPMVLGELRPAVEPTPVDATPPEDPGVVVALIDTGINPYHEAFQKEPAALPAAEDQAAGEPAKRVPITPADSMDAALAEDDPAWRPLERETLYRFPGTNVYGISMIGEDYEHDQYPVLDEYGHGTSTAHTVVHEEPEATVVMVEVSATSWSEIADAIQWTAEQAWIDVVSASLGNLGNVPNPLVAGGDPDLEVPQASKAVVDAGKLYVNSAGNDPTPHHTDNADGPPWAIAVSGAEPTTKGRDVIPANGPDVVANFTVNAATHDTTDGYAWTQGTSFSAPSTAGTLASTLLEARRALDAPGTGASGGALVDADGTTITNHDVRDALNRTAVYWDTTDWEPTEEPTNDTFRNALAASAPVAPAPWVQTGWGYVNASVTEEAAWHLLGEDTAEKPAPAEAYMGAQHDARKAYWDQRLDG